MNYIKYFKRQHFKKSSPKKLFYKEQLPWSDRENGIFHYYPDRYPNGFSDYTEHYKIHDAKGVKLENLTDLLFPHLSFNQLKFKLSDTETIYINITNKCYQIILMENDFKYYNSSYTINLDGRLKITFPYELEKIIGKQNYRDYTIEQLIQKEVKV